MNLEEIKALLPLVTVNFYEPHCLGRPKETINFDYPQPVLTDLSCTNCQHEIPTNHFCQACFLQAQFSDAEMIATKKHWEDKLAQKQIVCAPLFSRQTRSRQNEKKQFYLMLKMIHQDLSIINFGVLYSLSEIYLEDRAERFFLYTSSCENVFLGKRNLFLNWRKTLDIYNHWCAWVSRFSQSRGEQENDDLINLCETVSEECLRLFKIIQTFARKKHTSCVRLRLFVTCIVLSLIHSLLSVAISFFLKFNLPPQNYTNVGSIGIFIVDFHFLFKLHGKCYTRSVFYQLYQNALTRAMYVDSE